jgi:hypothetical protein
MGVNQLSDYADSGLTNTRSSRAACCLGDSLSGTAEVTYDFAGSRGHAGPTAFVGHVYGDSLSVLWPVPLTSGYSVMQFAGHRSAIALVGHSNNSEVIALTKQ